MRKSALARIVALGAAVSFVAACGQGGAQTDSSSGQPSFEKAFETAGPAPEGEPQAGGTVRFAYAAEPVSVDSVNCGSGMSWMACTAVYGGLVTFDPRTLEYGPGLAESFESGDGQQWEITLRPELTFTDGTPLDAEAVAFNWERAADPVSRNAARETVDSMEWEVRDDRTLVVTLDEVNYQFPSLLYTSLGMIGSPTAIREKGEDFAQNPVGAGPFVLDNWSRGTEMSFVRNDDYWAAPRPYLDKLVIVTIAQEQQRANALNSGDIDINTTTVPMTANELREAGRSEARMLNLAGSGIRFNMTEGPTTDERVRLAIAHAVNRAAIREAVWSTGAGPGTFAVEGGALFDPETTLPEYDPERAQEIVDEIRAENGGEDIVVEYSSLAGVSMMMEEGQLLKAQIEQIDGLTLEVVDHDAATYGTRVLGGEFEALSASMGLLLDPAALYSLHSGSNENLQGYSNPEYDRNIDLARATPDPQEQMKYSKEAVKHYVQDVAGIPWTPGATYWFHSGNIGGIAPGYNYYLRPDLLWRAD
ncbi:ABC transporter substrate-binding protein [Dietzia maris]